MDCLSNKLFTRTSLTQYNYWKFSVSNRLDQVIDLLHALRSTHETTWAARTIGAKPLFQLFLKVPDRERPLDKVDSTFMKSMGSHFRYALDREGNELNSRMVFLNDPYELQTTNRSAGKN